MICDIEFSVAAGFMVPAAIFLMDVFYKNVQ